MASKCRHQISTARTALYDRVGSWKARRRYSNVKPRPGQGLEAEVKAAVLGEEDSTQTPGPPGWGLDVGLTTHS